MCRARKVKLCYIIAAGGPELNNSQNVASCIGVKSIRLVGKLLLFKTEAYGRRKVSPYKLWWKFGSK